MGKKDENQVTDKGAVSLEEHELDQVFGAGAAGGGTKLDAPLLKIDINAAALIRKR